MLRPRHFCACHFKDCTRLLLVVVVFAFVLRLLGIGYGLPFTLFMDEYHEVMRALQLGTGSFNFDRAGKGGLYLILFLQFGTVFIAQLLTAQVSNANEFALEFIKDPTSLYMIGRVTVAMFGAAGVAAIYQLGKISYGRPAGLLAALILALNGLHVELSRVIGLDVMLLTLSTVALIYSLKVLEHGGMRNYVLAGFFAALATTTKLPGVLLLPILYACHLYQVRHRQLHWSGAFFDRYLFAGLSVFVIILVATNPGIVHGAKYLGLFTARDNETPDVGEEMEGGEHFLDAEHDNLYVFYFDAIQDAFGWPLLCFGIGGVIYALRHRRPVDIVLVSYALINLVVISSTTTGLYYPRYALPIMMILILLAARFVSSIADKTGRYSTISATAMVVALAFSPAYAAYENTVRSFREDARIVVRDWLVKNAPAGTRILVEGGKVGVKRSTVPLPESLDTLRKQYQYWLTNEPRQAKLIGYRIAIHTEPSFDLVYLRPDKIQDLNEYINQGVRVFVIQPGSLENPRLYGTSGRRFVSQLRSDERVEMAARVPGVDHPRFSSTIEVYVVDGFDFLPELNHSLETGI